MRGQPVDYVPCMRLVNPLSVEQRAGHPWNFPWLEPGTGLEYLASVLGTDPVVGVGWMDGVCPDPVVLVRSWREQGLLYKELHHTSR